MIPNSIEMFKLKFILYLIYRQGLNIYQIAIELIASICCAIDIHIRIM